MSLRVKEIALIMNEMYIFSLFPKPRIESQVNDEADFLKLFYPLVAEM